MSDDPLRGLRTHTAPAGLVRGAIGRSRRPGGGRQIGFGLLAGLVIGAFAYHVLATRPEVTTTAPVTATVPVTATAEETLVRLVVHVPEARTVGVAGTWNGWDAVASPMTPGKEGVFFITLRLPPGRYEYLFLVDGARWVDDSAAAIRVDDDFGSENMVLEV